MDSSRRAVEAYWRSRMIDEVTSDEDKVAPVYKLEEICDLLRTSDAGVVKEVSDYIFKRIDHKSPIVKQKAVRLIKYAVGKSGVDFRREMQRHSVVIRELCHYRGQPDPLKGDALNKAVRETAQEAMSSIFSSNDKKAPPSEGIGNRIEGFGNTNFDKRVEEKKSFLSEVVDLGRASIEQGLTSIAAAHLMKKNDNETFGSYRSPNLRRSLTNERDARDRYEANSSRGGWGSSDASKNTTSGTWNQDTTERVTIVATNGDASQSHSGSKSCEERLLETIVTSGGVRLQPTRDAIQIFLSEASKLNQLSMCAAIETKLQSNLWQVRMKAIFVLESLLRKKDDEHFSVISSYFSENRDNIVKCSDSPQVSLREKANKVLSLLEVENTSATSSHLGDSSTGKNIPTPALLPDLIDIPDGNKNEDFMQNHVSQNTMNLMPSGSLVDDLFANEPITGRDLSKNEGDPFADVSFHLSEDKHHVDDLFSGLTLDERKSTDDVNMVTNNHASDLLDIFGSESGQLSNKAAHGKADMHDLMTDFSGTNEVSSKNKQPGGMSAANTFGSTATPIDSSSQLVHLTGNEFPVGSLSSSQTVGINPVAHHAMGSIHYNVPPNMMFNQPFASQTVSYDAMGNFIAQQQFLLQNLGSVNAGISGGLTSAGNGSYSSPFPDIFNPSMKTVQHHAPVRTNSKEETKAFDFISDHISSARNTKRIV